MIKINRIKIYFFVDEISLKRNNLLTKCNKDFHQVDDKIRVNKMLLSLFFLSQQETSLVLDTSTNDSGNGCGAGHLQSHIQFHLSTKRNSSPTSVCHHHPTLGAGKVYFFRDVFFLSIEVNQIVKTNFLKKNV